MPKIRGRGYSDETAAKVKAAFDEIDARGEVIMPIDIARMTEKGQTAVQRVLQSAPYWTPEHVRDARREAQRRGARKRAEDTAMKVRVAFDELNARDEVVMPGDIAQMIGRDRHRVYRVLREASYWTPEHSSAVKKEINRRAVATRAEGGWQSLKKGLATRAEGGWQSFKKANAIQAEGGWQSLKKAKIVRSRIQRGQPLSPNHPNVRQGERQRLRIYATLASWNEMQNGRLTQTAVSRVLEISQPQVHFHLRRLRADGLIDTTNHVIAPWPDFDTPPPTAVDDTNHTHERAERE